MVGEWRRPSPTLQLSTDRIAVTLCATACKHVTPVWGVWAQVDGLALAEVVPMPGAHARALAFSPGASTLAVGTSTNDIIVVTLDRATLARGAVQTVVQGHFGSVYSVAEHPTLPAFVSAAGDHTPRSTSS